MTIWRLWPILVYSISRLYIKNGAIFEKQLVIIQCVL